MRDGSTILSPVKDTVKPIDYKEINNKIGLNNITVHQAPVLTISAWCHNHIKALHKKYPSTERTAICKVINKWDWQFEMVDMIHPWQKTTSGEVETTDEWMEWAIKYLLERWEDIWEWNLILHSHHWMGCFWSNTDDNARLSMNDWRMLMRAVVTAYKWDEINYKGCLNFYKPYPIEIDCDIEYYTDDLYGQREEYGNYIENRTKEIYNDMVINDETLKSYKCEYDYDNLLRYLWIDITEELKKNSEVIQMKMPCEWYEDRLKEIMEEAKEKVQGEIQEPINKDLAERSKWSNDLMVQLEDNIEKPKYNYTWNYYGYDWRGYNYDYDYHKYDCDKDTLLEEKTPKKDDLDNEYFQFNDEQYPTKESVYDTLWLDRRFKLKLNEDTHLREVWCSQYKQWLYLWDELEDLFEYPEEYL